MPNIDGGSSSERDYAPHMWVLKHEGDPDRDEDYIYVGNAVAFYDDQEAQRHYQIGVTGLGEIACSSSVIVGVGEAKLPPVGMRGEDIPEAAKKVLFQEGLRQIGTLQGQIILSGLGIGLPEGVDLELINLGRYFNGTLEERKTEELKTAQWQNIASQLRRHYE